MGCYSCIHLRILKLQVYKRDLRSNRTTNRKENIVHVRGTRQTRDMMQSHHAATTAARENIRREGNDSNQTCKRAHFPSLRVRAITGRNGSLLSQAAILSQIIHSLPLPRRSACLWLVKPIRLCRVLHLSEGPAQPTRASQRVYLAFCRTRIQDLYIEA